MRRGPIFAMILLPLAGCVPPPGGPGYGYGGYPQPYQGGGSAPPVYGDPNAGYSGYAYNDGAPYIVEEGVTLPLIFFGGAWGYYDRERHFRRAPEHVYRELQSRHPGGSGARVFSGQAAPPHFNGGGQAAPHFNGGGQAQPPHFNGGGQAQPHFNAPPPVQHTQPSFAAPPHHAAPVAAPPVQHTAPPARQEEHRGRQQCPPGQFRC